jgi:small subunit ribosomal protein S10
MLVDKSAEKIVKTCTGAVVTDQFHYQLIKLFYGSTFSARKQKKAREQFEVMSYKRLIDIYLHLQKTIDALMKLPSGVEVEIKV